MVIDDVTQHELSPVLLYAMHEAGLVHEHPCTIDW